MTQTPDTRLKVTWIVIYSVSASTLLVINKLAVRSTGLPAGVTGAQLLFSASVVIAMQLTGLKVLGPPQKKKLVSFFVFTCIFATSLYTNMKALLYSNVGAVIGAGCALPILVNAIEVTFMGKALPSRRSFLSLFGVLISAVVYIFFDTGVHVDSQRGLFWLSSWWFTLALSNTYGKFLTEHIDMGHWERVFYTNALSLFPMTALFYSDSEHLSSPVLSRYSVFFVSLSCVFGVSISYSGWKCRSLVTATTFTLVGCLNKIITIMISVLTWPNEFSILKLCALAVCIMFGVIYQDEEPKRKKQPNIDYRSQQQVDGTINLVIE